MTWQEFKEMVDKALEERGISEVKIFYIDTRDYPNELHISIHVSKDGWLKIS